eukprot:TRINITY_DN33588_c0_g1_i1.p1 TRINITY_DN33588_c0_g1~~TRINITY_DN33588_c0_g1_i1.p1  ORF type:complete len:427 (+),score=126.86 TRINITY_DN33588_c0_g1_i1:78-1283(+)
MAEEAADAPPPLPPAAPAAAAAPDASNGASNGGGSGESLAVQVQRLKVTLENPSSSDATLLEAMAELTKLGELPTKVLSDTGIGKVVNTVSKSSKIDAVRKTAAELVTSWRQAHRKKKGSSDNLARTTSTASVGSDSGMPTSQPDAASPAKKRRVEASPAASQETEASATPASQEEAGLTLTRQDSLLLTQSEVDLAQAAEAPAEGVAEGAATEAQPEATSGATEPNKMTQQREKVRQKILDAFGKEEETIGQAMAGDDMKDPVALAAEIEDELNKQLKEKEYFNQARAIIFNLKDKKNIAFRLKLLMGSWNIEEIPKLTAEDMASDAKTSERAALRKFAMEEIQSDWAMKNGQIRITGMFTCGKCKGTKTTYYQMQTRSSDEPMTTFASCLSCGNRWKFC